MAGRAEGNIVHRLAARATTTARAGAVTWAALIVLVAPAAQTSPSGATIALMAGALGLWTLSAVAVVAVVATAGSYLPWTQPDGSQPDPIGLHTVGRHYAVLLAVAAIVFVAPRRRRMTRRPGADTARWAGGR